MSLAISNTTSRPKPGNLSNQCKGNATASARHNAVDAPESGVISIRKPLRLECGKILSNWQIGWQSVGPVGAPAVVALGGISADRNVWCPTSARPSGWWANVFAGIAPSTLRSRRLISFDWLGGNGETSGPHNHRDLSADTIRLTTNDQANVLAHLLDELDIAQLDCLVGASFGGMVGLAFASNFPDRLRAQLIIAASHRADPLAQARRAIQREILSLEGDTKDQFLELARKLGISSYRSQTEFASRFGPDAESSEDYLRVQGARASEFFSLSAYRLLSDAIDTHSVVASAIRVPTTLVGIRNDQIVPPYLYRELAAAAGATLIELGSRYGHDAFLADDEQIAPLIAGAFGGRLA